ncbi:MAG: hypothetical protein JW395_0953 [Nitrospira sp.]|nr:hypothetical protein [Nitrospira sp.]
MGREVSHNFSKDRESRHLRWNTFQRRIADGLPSVEPVAGTPRVMLFIDAGGARIGVRFHACEPRMPLSPLSEVSIRVVGAGSRRVAEVSTTNRLLYRDFYIFCCAVADRVQLNNQPVRQAIAETLGAWSALLSQRSLLSRESQIGLLGVLLFLTRLAAAIGWKNAVKSWQGPAAEEHDFAVDGLDLEVKTTLSERRVHQIGSVTQLMPKLRRRLVLISIQLTPVAGKSGSSLADTVANVLASVTEKAPESVDTLRALLAQVGWDETDAAHYCQPYRLRTALAAIEVDRSCPAIVPKTLARLGKHLTSRIESVSYAVDVDGLGALDGTRAFKKLVFNR